MAPVIVDRRGHTLLLVLNRPAARNGATAEMASLVGDALHAAEADRSIRAVVLTGAGERSFCAGADLAGVARQASAKSRSPRVELPGLGATASQGPTDRRGQRLRAGRRIPHCRGAYDAFSILSRDRRGKSPGDRDDDRSTDDYHQHSAESLIPRLWNTKGAFIIHRHQDSEDSQ
ncbi:MAG: crotonobetainyl-CoA hydratase [Mycobacterium sp.]|nr:crotonobetainyl-CoA hydratase [Mycobacterium sp.]